MTKFPPVRSRLPAAGWPGLLSAIALAVLGVGVFVLLAQGMPAGSALTEPDRQLAAWIASHRSAGLVAFCRGVSHAHGTTPVMVAAWLLAIWLIYRAEWRWLASLVLAVPAGMLLLTALKHWVQQAQPMLAMAMYRFPSGHVGRAVLLYGFACALLFAHQRWRPARALAVGGAVAALLLVAFSRMCLRPYALADILAAAAVSVAWLALALSLTQGRAATLRDKG